MIVCYSDHIEISLPVAAALLAFACKDECRRQLGVGIDNGDLCATDGHRLVAFGFAEAKSIHHGKVWAYAHVETALKVAKATKATTVKLAFADCVAGERFPPASQVMPADGFEMGNTACVGVNPAYLADLTKVSKACEVPSVRLTSMGRELDPIGFRVGGGMGLSARVAIMPMRI